jgi:hypothetical protein
MALDPNSIAEPADGGLVQSGDHGRQGLGLGTLTAFNGQ